MKVGISILKAFNGYKWVNAYRADVVNLAEGVDLAEALAEYESAFHLDAVDFEGYRVWALNTSDPNDFTTGDFDLQGQRGASFEIYPPPFVALHVKLLTASGRPGKKLYRYALTQDDVKGVGDKGQLDTTFAADSGWTAALGTLVATIATLGSVLHIGGNASGVGSRAVISHSIGGVAQLDVRHGWYNRGS